MSNEMSNEHRLDLEKDLRVWVDSTPPGGRPVVPRAVDMGNGLVAHMPERLFIQVATEATPETRRAPTGAQVVQLDENGERVLGEGYQNVSFEIGRQVVFPQQSFFSGHPRIFEFRKIPQMMMAIYNLYLFRRHHPRL